jgi:hypothetical protein
MPTLLASPSLAKARVGISSLKGTITSSVIQRLLLCTVAHVTATRYATSGSGDDGAVLILGRIVSSAPEVKIPTLSLQEPQGQEWGTRFADAATEPGFAPPDSRGRLSLRKLHYAIPRTCIPNLRDATLEQI